MRFILKLCGFLFASLFFVEALHALSDGGSVDKDESLTAKEFLRTSTNVPPTLPDRTFNEFRSEENFAAILEDGSVFFWSPSNLKGKVKKWSSGITPVSITSNTAAFTVLLSNGKLSSWGDERYGAKAPELSKDQRAIALASTQRAFAAVVVDEAFHQMIVTWGSFEDEGGVWGVVSGDPMQVLPVERTIKSLFSTKNAFVALLDNGEIVPWGNSSYGGAVPLLPWYSLPEAPIDSVVSSDNEFLFLFHDGELLKTSPDASTQATLQQLSEGDPLDTMVESQNSFVLFSKNGGVTLWNDDFFGDDPTLPMLSLKKEITTSCISTLGAFAMKLSNDTIAAWGDPLAGGQTPLLPLSAQGEKVDSIVATEDAFAALLHGGSIISWGSHNNASTLGSTPLLLPGHRVISLISNSKLFTALVEDQVTHDQSLLVWGDFSATVEKAMPQLPSGKKVLSMTAANSAFTALLDDGTLFTWGGKFGGGIITIPPSKVISMASPFQKEEIHFMN